MSETNNKNRASEYLLNAGIKESDQIWGEIEPFVLKMIEYRDSNDNSLNSQNIENFISTYMRFKAGEGEKYLRNQIHPIHTDDKRIIRYSEIQDLREIGEKEFSRLSTIKLSGGLGTSMGCTYAKCAIEVYNNLSFLQLLKKQNDSLNSNLVSNSDLWLMSSFKTTNSIKKELGEGNYKEFLQGAFPKIDSSSNNLKPLDAQNDDDEWNPPGHGDIYTSMRSVDWVDEQIDMGKEFVFISNFDNLKATFDPSLLGVMVSRDLDFIIETTEKTASDTKGGSLIEENGNLKLLEIAQVDESDIEAISKFQDLPIFNTNNIWIRLSALKKVIDKGEFELPIIMNNKEVDGMPVIQLESAMGSAIELFDNSATVVVPRSRFLPIKRTSDLLLLRSDLYIKKEDGNVEINDERRSEFIQEFPTIELSKEFSSLSEMEARFKSTPSLLNTKSLKLEGDIWFEEDIIIEGDVEIIQNHGVYRVESGTLLKDVQIIDGEVITRNS